MTPEEHYICAMSALEMPEAEQREFVAEFRRSLIEHDTRVIEDFLYGSDTYRLAAAEWASGYRAAERTTLSQKAEEGFYLGPMSPEENETLATSEIPAFADMSTCDWCGGEYPTDELYDEWCEACLRVGGSV